MHELVNAIKERQSATVDSQAMATTQVFLDIAIFNFDVGPRPRQQLLGSSRGHGFMTLLLLKLKLFLKYEGKLLFVDRPCFDFLSQAFNGFLDGIAQADYESDSMIALLALLLQVASKIFLKVGRPSGGQLGFELMRQSMLASLRNAAILSTTNFWRQLFELRFARVRHFDNSVKSRVINVAQRMLFHHFFLSLNIDYSQSFVEHCIKRFHTNLRVIRGSVALKVGKYLHQLCQPSCSAPLANDVSQQDRLALALSLVLSRQFFNADQAVVLLRLSKGIYKFLSTEFIVQQLRQQFHPSRRKSLWLDYIRLQMPQPDRSP